MNKIYRPNVAAIIVSSDYPNTKDIFVAQRCDLKNVWQFPQGGIDEGEDAKTALFRELEEEIGTNDVEIISQYPEWISYDFPQHIANKMKPFAGQTQRYYLVKLSKDATINLDTDHPEFDDYKFVKADEVLNEIAKFKKDVYTKVINYFQNEGVL